MLQIFWCSIVCLCVFVPLLRHVCREWALLSFHSVCLSGCLSVIPRPTACHDRSITTIFGQQVYTCPRTRVSLFGSPIFHTFSARGKNVQNLAYFQRQPFNAYSCHCERDASFHMTCLSVCYPWPWTLQKWLNWSICRLGVGRLARALITKYQLGMLLL